MGESQPVSHDRFYSTDSFSRERRTMRGMFESPGGRRLRVGFGASVAHGLLQVLDLYSPIALPDCAVLTCRFRFRSVSDVALATSPCPPGISKKTVCSSARPTIGLSTDNRANNARK